MKLRLLLSSAAAVCLALPSTALADPPPDRGQGAQNHSKPQGKSGQDHNQASPAHGNRQTPQSPAPGPGRASGSQAPGQERRRAETPRGPGPAPVSAPAARSVGQGGGSGGRQTGQPRAPSGGFVVSPPSPVARSQERGVSNARAPQGQPRPAQPQAPNRQAYAHRPAPPALAGWNRNLRGADRDRAGQQWRQTYSGWDRSAPWRSNREWWRGDSSFSLFVGPRIGFFFFPGIGYVSAPWQYRERHWRAGEYLPNWFWRYAVRDYYRYGLPQPPYGCAWVWLNGDVALIDTSDGYILDVVRNVW